MLRLRNTWRDGRWLMLGGCLLFGGCGQQAAKLPETFPVTGEVRYPDGAPIAKGIIQFQSEGNPSLNISGAIADGKFSLLTAFDKGTAAGTMAGRYRVSVTPAFEVTPVTIQLPETYEIRPEPMQLDLKLPPVQK